MYRKKPKKVEKPVFPETLEGFGYKIDEEGKLRRIDDDSPFVFEVKEKDRPYNEAHYEALLDVIGSIVEDKMQAEPYDLVRHLIPISANPADGDMFSNVYMSANALETTDKLLLLIPPSNIRVGQWTRRVMIDDSIYSGSMLDTIKRAREEGFEVFVFNPNENFWCKGRGWSNLFSHMRKYQEIPGSETPEAHCRYVFEHFIKHAKANNIAVIASAWGAYCLMDLMNNNFEFFRRQVRAVALANSVHSRDTIVGDGKLVWLHENVVNWIVSDANFGDMVEDLRFGCNSVSAAVELTDHIIPKAMDPIFKFFRLKITGGDDELDNISDNEDRDLTQEEEAELAAHLEKVYIGPTFGAER